MMILNHRSYWVKLAYPFKHKEAWRLPSSTNVCALFWRAVRTLTLASALLFVAGMALAFIITTVMMYPWDTLTGVAIFLLCAVVVFFGIVGVVWMVKHEDNLRLAVDGAAEWVVESVPAQAFIGWKERHCRVVRIERGE